MPEIVLALTEGNYRISPGLMRKDPPSEEELLNRFREVGREEISPALWGCMLDYIYAGNAASAWRICRMVLGEGRREDYFLR